MKALLGIIQRDLLLALRRKSDMLTQLLFFIMVASLFPLGVGPEPDVLRRMAPGVLWVAALLASLLGLNRLFAQDQVDGTLEQLLLSSTPLALIVTGKVAAHWMVSGLPLVLAAPLLAVQYDMAPGAARVLCLGLLIGTPILSLVGAIGAALALGARGGSVLVALIIIPLYIPILILGAGAVGAETSGLGSDAHLMLLGALLLGAAALAPWATATALRVAFE